MNSETVYLSIHIHTSGFNYNDNGILSIGYCAGLQNGNVILKKRISFILSENCTFDKKYLDTFWNSNSEILNTLSTESVRIKDGLNEFMNDIDNLDRIYNVIIILDHPLFTMGFINHYLLTYMNRLPLYYINGDYNKSRVVIDVNSFLKGVLKVSKDENKILRIRSINNIQESRLPNESAEFLYFHYIAIMDYLNQK